ncbi:MAG: aminotransferase class IV [Schwartzia sp.]|nr:aminotransferase class IV [Schwartzia sp. (in: firmicutes)]
MKEIVYIDGAFIDLNEYAVQLEDRGYMFGDGICETVRFYDKKCFALRRHLAQYRRSMKELNIPITDTDVEIVNLFDEMIEKSGADNGLIYLQLTRGTAKREYKFPVPSLPHLNAILRDTPVDEAAQQNGIKAVLVEDIRWLRCDIGSLNLLGNILAYDEARRAFADDAILYRKDTGHITEATGGNFFIVKDGILWTHPADNLILNGVTRSILIDRIAKPLDLTVVQKNFDKEFMMKAEEAFITSTENEIVPVISIGKQKIGDGKMGDVTKKILDAYHALTARGIDTDEEEEEKDKVEGKKTFGM